VDFFETVEDQIKRKEALKSEAERGNNNKEQGDERKRRCHQLA